MVSVQNSNLDFIVEQYLRVHKDPQRLKNEINALIKIIETGSKAVIENEVSEKLKLQVNKEKKEKLRLSEYIADRIQKRSELLEIFQQCVEYVKKQTEMRKLFTKATVGSPNGSNAFNFGEKRELKNFLGTEKQAIVELFVTNRDVLYAIYNIMFPKEKAGGLKLNKGSTNMIQPNEPEESVNVSQFEDVFAEGSDFWTNTPAQSKQQDLLNQSYNFQDHENFKLRANSTNASRNKYYVQDGRILLRGEKFNTQKNANRTLLIIRANH